MRKFLFTLFFVFLISMPVFASDFGSFNYSTSYNNLGVDNYSVSVSNFTVLDDTSVDEVKIYAFNYNSTVTPDVSHIAVVGNVPFSYDCTVTYGAEKTVGTIVCDNTSSWYFYAPNKVTSSTKKSGIGGYYGSYIFFNPNYPFLSGSGYVKTFSYDISCSATSIPSVFMTDVSSYFFQLPPTLNNQGQTGEMKTVGEVLLTFLASGVGLVILLMALLILVTLLVRYLRRCLTL